MVLGQISFVLASHQNAIWPVKQSIKLCLVFFQDKDRQHAQIGIMVEFAIALIGKLDGINRHSFNSFRLRVGECVQLLGSSGINLSLTKYHIALYCIQLCYPWHNNPTCFLGYTPHYWLLCSVRAVKAAAFTDKVRVTAYFVELELLQVWSKTSSPELTHLLNLL